MIKRVYIKDSELEISELSEGENIEMSIKRAIENGESIGEQVPRIYTEKKDGVMAGYDIRTDRWEIALQGTDIMQKTRAAKRLELIKSREESSEPKGDEPIHTTGENSK